MSDSLRERLAHLKMNPPSAGITPGFQKQVDEINAYNAVPLVVADAVGFFGFQLRKLAALIAKESAVHYAENNDLASAPYLQTADQPDWEAHPWVINAVYEALKQGMQIQKDMSHVSF